MNSDVIVVEPLDTCQIKLLPKGYAGRTVRYATRRSVLVGAKRRTTPTFG